MLNNYNNDRDDKNDNNRGEESITNLTIFKMDRAKWKIIWIILIILSLIFFRVFFYLFAEFILHTHVYDHDGQTPNCPANDGTIPKVIHQVMFNTSIPKPYLDARENCNRININFVSILWNKTMVDNLVHTHYPFLKKLFYGYDIWVKRADVARYLIIHHYGGIYIDLDSNCTGSFESLWHHEQSIKGKVIVRTTTPVGFSNDFIVSPPCHPFLWEVIMSLQYSNRWYIFPYANTMFSTGPTFFWGRYLNFKKPEEFIVIENYTQYFTSLHWSSWHNWDGHVIRFATRNSSAFFTIFVFIIIIIVVCIKRLKLWPNEKRM